MTDAPPLATPAIGADGNAWGTGNLPASRDFAVSPDGALVATCRDGSVGVLLIDLRTGKDAGTLVDRPDERSDRTRERSEMQKEPGVQTEAVAFSPDGQTLAEAVGRSLRLWKLAQRRIERRMTAHDVISAIGFSPDGRRLAVALGERLELWDVATQARLAAWQAHGSRINVLAFSPDGLLASASQDRFVRLWSGTTGEAVATFSGHTGFVSALAFSPNGQLLASGCGDEVKLWSLSSYEEIATLKGFRGAVRGLAFSPNHLILAAVGALPGQGGYIRLWCAAGPDAHWSALAQTDLSASVRP